ncbi:uncharacterized protein MELLADRAFT_111964 [Melampsora larici-populina 98AG31]|uniref:Uncharacterized protein n=1 Tax=Melampsora larici-populina (strain 98AG31 / pathotype 3-4-7) TaxID=747676 RepID=F4S4X9_MELLP|nr:uncharacterized protein MELLADRAFT_111964 [Melampsora larici-populina 98AG31]EGG00223.1 hypothetical protein MELLADRAFT_111964 [Melampsora larici-populina 98AG31]
MLKQPNPNPNQKTRVNIFKPQTFTSAPTAPTFPHNETNPQQNRGNRALPLTPNSSTSPVEPNHEATTKFQGEEHLEVQAPPPVSTLPVKVVAAIGVILLLLSCSLLVYKLIQDWRRQEPSSRDKTSMDMDQNGTQGAKGKILSQQGGTQDSISRPKVIHLGSRVLKRDTYRSQDSFGYIPQIPINLDTPGFPGTRLRRSFVLNFNPYHHWERAMNLQHKEMNYFTQAMASSSTNNQFYNEKALPPIQTKTLASHQCISMNENQVIRDDLLLIPQNQELEIRTQNLHNEQQALNEDIFFLENVEQKISEAL